MLYIYSESFEGSAEENAQLLSLSVSKRPWFGDPKTVFQGRVAGRKFCVSRVVRGMDTYNPLMRGSISTVGTRSLVRVVMTLHPVAVVLLAGWSFFLARAASAHGSIPTVLWFPIVAPWLIGIPVFFYDARRSRALLRQCLSLTPRADGCANKPAEGVSATPPPSNP